MRFFIKTTVIALLAGLLTGCCRPCRIYQRSQRPLAGTSWQLIQIYGQNFHPDSGRFTLRFDQQQGRVSGMAACNSISGEYSTTEKRGLKIERLASTQKLCLRDGDKEALLIKALENATHYEMDGPMLMILSHGELLALFQSLPGEETSR